MAGQEDQSKEGRRRLKVLVAVDASAISDKVVKRSGQFAKITDCDLTVLTVMEDVVRYENLPDTPLYNERKQKADSILQKARGALQKHGIDCRTRLAIGPIASEIVRFAEEGRYDIIFVGSRGLGGLKRMLLGSVADDVLRHAHCSVTLVR